MLPKMSLKVVLRVSLKVVFKVSLTPLPPLPRCP